MLWTPRQRVTLACLTGAFLLYLLIRLLMNPLYVPAELPPEGPRAGELMDRIDPNTADAATLAALPVVGPSLAEKIVAYREEFAAKNPSRRAFEKLDDLDNVHGIGPATLKHIEPYLLFDSPYRPATRP